MSTAVSLPKNNAFGVDSPSWNLPFPEGNMTVAEVLAYLPHWLKSIDIIDRFVVHGARPTTIAMMINEFRHQPNGDPFQANSVQIMMSYAMRRAGFKDWTVGTHDLWMRESERKKEDSLSVKDFRPPRLTHPRTVTSRNHDNTLNSEAEPVAFKDLALHVKRHPSGNDALDLTRCVKYALDHQSERWLFPAHFERLINHLGGPQLITPFHYDRQVFARREKFASPAKRKRGKLIHASDGNAIPLSLTMPQARMKNALRKPESVATPGKTQSQNCEGEGLGRLLLGNKRRSGRLLGKVINLREEDSDTTQDKEFSNYRHSKSLGPNNGRKISFNVPAPDSPTNDSEFIQDESEPDDDIPEAEEASDEGIESPSRAKYDRVAAQKARLNIQSSFVRGRAAVMLREPNLGSLPENNMSPFQLKMKPVPRYMSTMASPEILCAVNAFPNRQPKFLQPPVLSANRLRVDPNSIFLYAAEGCSSINEMWASTLSSTRFNGPRRSAPYRELYRLSDPPHHDDSDWAENIRWAKEQHRAFGSMTWTEYDYHLELITAARMETMWVSEEAIKAGM